MKSSVAPNIFFDAINKFQWIAALVGEDQHGHHHLHATLARRPGIDLSFQVFVRPLHALGLVSNVNVTRDVVLQDAAR
jgi:fatty-acid desaturase